MKALLLTAAAVLGSTALAHATVIDFEAQGANSPSTFTAGASAPLTIGVATFATGQLLNRESGGSNSPDQTAVYASFYLQQGTNPLTISFAAAVGSFSILLTNLATDTYTVSDNLGESVSQAIDMTSSATLALPATSGITQVFVAASPNSRYNFAIDNVSFTQAAPTSIPEPTSLALLGLGMAGIAATRRRRAE